MQTSQLLPGLGLSATVATATLATEPPAKASMIALAAMSPNRAAHRLARMMLFGSTATPRTLVNGKIWGWDETAGQPVFLGFVLDGVTITVATTQGGAQLLADVLGCYSHVGVTGTLAADSLVINVAPVEVSGD